MFLCGLRLCAVALAGLFGFVLTAGPAMAGDDYTPPPSVEVEDDTVTMAGENCDVGAEVTVTLGGIEVATTIVRPDGTFSVTFKVPAGTDPGNYEVKAAGCGAEVLGTTITMAGPTVGSNALPKTGSSSTEPLVRTGAVLVVAGAAVVYAVRRRQNATTGT